MMKPMRNMGVFTTDPNTLVLSQTTPPSSISSTVFQRVLGSKFYELKNHLGNVLAVVSDEKLPEWNFSFTVTSTKPVVVSYTDYYPFGAPMPGRNYSSNDYRYGFNGMEKDDELKGSGCSYDFGARIYDSRVGRWLSVDALEGKYPSYSPYSTNANSPLIIKDINGDEIVISNVVKDDHGNIMSMDIKLTGKIRFMDGHAYKSASAQKIWIDTYKEKLITKFEKTGEAAGVKINFSCDLTQAKTQEEISENDHAIYVISSTSKSYGEDNTDAYVGLIGGKTMYLDWGDVKGNVNNDLAHELGHWLGMIHPKDLRQLGLIGTLPTGEVYDVKYNYFSLFSKYNIMHHPGDTDANSEDLTQFDQIQFQMMESFYKKEILNSGSNSYDPTDKQSYRSDRTCLRAWRRYLMQEYPNCDLYRVK